MSFSAVCFSGRSLRQSAGRHLAEAAEEGDGVRETPVGPGRHYLSTGRISLACQRLSHTQYNTPRVTPFCFLILSNY